MNKITVTKLYRKYHRELAQLLSLTSWHIKVSFVADTVDLNNACVQMELTDFNHPYNEVNLKIFYKSFETEEEFRRTLFHEYVHLVVYPLAKHVAPKYIGDEELVVSHLTNALYPVLYSEALKHE